VRLSFVRQKRAEHALAEAEAPLRRARAELQQAERELAQNKRRLSASALDWRTASPHRETLGRELVRAHAALLERSAQLAAQVERVAASARLCLQAQGNLRAISARASCRNEQLRRWVRDLEKSGNP
jgi:chromosome segregation ATPase